MNLQPLYILKERLENCAVAGVGLLDEDFRLKRAVEQFMPLAGAAPVFGKIGAAAQKLLEPATPNRCQVLMDTLALVSAVAYTQGTTQVPGEIEDITLPQGVVYIPAAYSAVKPLYEALTTTGSGRWEVVSTAIENDSMALRDYRILPAIIGGLGDSYGEMAELLERYLSGRGKEILPLLKQGFDPKGKKDMIRRLHVVENVAGGDENDWYIRLLDDTEKELRAAVISALRHKQENTPLLLDLVRSEKGNCKKAAQSALSFMEGEESLSYWRKELAKKPGALAPFLTLSTGDALSDILADTLGRQVDALLQQKEAGTAVVDNETQAALKALLDATLGMASEKLCAFYRRMLAAGEAYKIDELKNAKGKPLGFALQCGGYGSTDTLLFSQKLRECLLGSLLYHPDDRLFAICRSLYEETAEDRRGEFLAPAFVTALLTQTKEDVFTAFSPYLMREGLLSVLRKENPRQEENRKQLVGVLGMIHWEEDRKAYVISRWYADPVQERTYRAAISIPQGLDSRWFSLLTDSRLKKTGEFAYTPSYGGNTTGDYDAVMSGLLNPYNSACRAAMGRYFYDRSLALKDSNRFLSQLKQCGWTDYDALFDLFLEKGKTVRYWEVTRFLQELDIPDVDKADKLEKVNRMVEEKQIKFRDGYWPADKIKRIAASLRAGNGWVDD